MTECSGCKVELSVLVPKGTEIYCKRCVSRVKAPDKPYDTLITLTLEDLIKEYQEQLDFDLERFHKEINMPYTFEKDYVLIGCQNSIDRCRNVLHVLKSLINEEQEDVIFSLE